MNEELLQYQAEMNRVQQERLDAMEFALYPWSRKRTFWQKVKDWVWCKLNPVARLKRG